MKDKREGREGKARFQKTKWIMGREQEGGDWKGERARQ